MKRHNRIPLFFKEASLFEAGCRRYKNVAIGRVPTVRVVQQTGQVECKWMVKSMQLLTRELSSEAVRAKGEAGSAQSPRR